MVNNYALKEATLNITALCNSDCVYCECRYLDPKSDMSRDRLIKLLDEMARLKIEKLNIFGGEPFLRSDIWDIIDYASSKRMHLTLGTNGLSAARFSEEKLRILNRCVSSIFVSLDSPVPKKQNYLRGRTDAYELTIKGLKNLRKLKKTHLGITTVISKRNFMDIPLLIQVIGALGVTSVHFQPINIGSNYPGVTANREKRDLLITHQKDLEKLKTIIQEAMCISKQMNIVTNLPTLNHWIYHYFKYVNNRDLWFLKWKKDFKCIVPFISVYITHDGFIQPCALLPKVAEIKNSSFENVYWKMNPIKRRLKNNDFPPQCRNCFCHVESNLNLGQSLNITQQSVSGSALLRNQPECRTSERL